jgi:hypothetical protein
MEKTLVAEWIHPHHRDKVYLISQFYGKPPKQFNGWTLVKQNTRWGVYEKGGEYFVLLKGTNPKSFQDLHDDLNIALEGPDWVSLIKEGDEVIQSLDHRHKISVGGHSLGGYSALYLGQKHNIETLALNPAATANAPMMYGPGPHLATTYHIAGDHISSNGNDDYSRIVRADLGYEGYQTIKAHNTDNFFKGTPKGFLTQGQEQFRNSNDLIYKALHKLKGDPKKQSTTIVEHLYKVGHTLKKAYDHGKQTYETGKRAWNAGKQLWDYFTGGEFSTDAKEIKGLIEML